MAIRVLFVDDEDALRVLVRKQLEAAGFAVTVADDGDTAMNFLQKDTFDLVLLDIQMPRMDGISVLKEMREKKMTPRVIMLTAVEDFSAAIEAVKMGAVDYITKPYEIDEVVDRIREVVAK